MAYLDYDPSLDFDAQETQMLQAAARIKALRDKNVYTPTSNEEVGGFSSAMTPGFKYSGRIQKTPLLSAIAPVLQDYTAGQMDKELARGRGDLSAAENAAVTNWIAGAPKGTPAQPGVTPLTPNDDQGNPMPSSPAVAAVPPTNAEVMAHAAAGLKTGPLGKTMAQQYLSDRLIKEPEREETRAARLQEKTLAAQQAAQKQKDEIEFKRWQTQQTIAGHAQTAEIMAAASRANAASRGDPNAGTWVISPNLDADGNQFMYNNKHPEQTRVVGAKPDKPAPPPKPLTKDEQSKLDTTLANTQVFSNAFHSLKPEHTGKYAQASAYGGQHLGIFGSDTAQFWSPVEEQKALKNKLISGANFTKPEMDRADKYQPGVGRTFDQNKQEMGQLAIDSGLANLRANFLHQYPGSYVDKDGAVVLKDGRVIKETTSREISKEEMDAQRLDPIPNMRDIEARLPPPAAARGRAPAPQQSSQPAGALPPPQPGEVRKGYRFKGGNPNVNTNWEPA